MKRAGAGARAPVALMGLALVLAAMVAGAQDGATPPRPGGLRGRVRIGIEGVKLADLGPTVLYVDALEGKLAYDVPAAVPQITQRNVKFSPSFLAIAAGQTVEMPNADEITHNVFSYSKPNDFDLGIYPKGASRRVKLQHPGVVRVYCSIHASMNATIFVAPSTHFARADAAGAFEIPGVPPGAYRLRLWSEMLPEASRAVVVRPETITDVEMLVEGEAK